MLSLGRWEPNLGLSERFAGLCRRSGWAFLGKIGATSSTRDNEPIREKIRGERAAGMECERQEQDSLVGTLDDGQPPTPDKDPGNPN